MAGFRVDRRFQFGRNGIYFYTGPTAAKGAQVCITDTDAVAVADGTAVTPFRSGLEISIMWI